MKRISGLIYGVLKSLFHNVANNDLSRYRSKFSSVLDIKEVERMTRREDSEHTLTQ